MALAGLPRCNLENLTSYSCDNPYPDCINDFGFQFASIWLITQAIALCPNDTRLVPHSADLGQPTLKQKPCQGFVNGEPTSDTWTSYPPADIWGRLTTWKFPLLQLVAVFPRPPLSLLCTPFVLLRLLGDPISTITDTILKLASCQARARFWRDRFEDEDCLGKLVRPENAFDLTSYDISSWWKELGAISDSYDEWGQAKGNQIESFIFAQLTSPRTNNVQKKILLNICSSTGRSLAADRSTKFFPIIIAQCFFIGTVGIAFGRTKDSASGPNPPTFINIEAHSIAFSSLYFWIVPAMIFGSIIGASQTEESMPRILRDFAKHVEANFPNLRQGLDRLNDHLIRGGKEIASTEEREWNGGIYSWQPHEARQEIRRTLARPLYNRRNIELTNARQSFIHNVKSLFNINPGSLRLGFVILFACGITGLLISLLVPPFGFECRHIAELLMVLVWIISACLSRLQVFRNDHRAAFAFLLIKDSITTAATMGGIIATQIGVFNRCACYTLWGKVGLTLPESTGVGNILFHRIDTWYPAIAFLCVGLQLIVIPGIVLWQFRDGVRVFLQRDDGKSNLTRLQWMRKPWSVLVFIFTTLVRLLGR